MPEYRRNRVPCRTFFTLNLLDRRSNLLVAHVDVLRGAVRRTRLRSPFRIDAWSFCPSTCIACGPRPLPGQAPAARRCRLPRSLARHQNRLCEILAERRAAITGHDPPRRARDLAATVLGTYDPRPTGFRRAHGLHAFQPGPHPSLPRDPRVKPGEGRVEEGEHPADWPHSSFHRCCEWPLSRRMDGRRRRAASDRRAAVKSETGEHRAKP